MLMREAPLERTAPQSSPYPSFPIHFASRRHQQAFCEALLDAANAALKRVASFDTGLEVASFTRAAGGATAGALQGARRAVL